MEKVGFEIGYTFNVLADVSVSRRKMLHEICRLTQALQADKNDRFSHGPASVVGFREVWRPVRKGTAAQCPSEPGATGARRGSCLRARQNCSGIEGARRRLREAEPCI